MQNVDKIHETAKGITINLSGLESDLEAFITSFNKWSAGTRGPVDIAKSIFKAFADAKTDVARVHEEAVARFQRIQTVSDDLASALSLATAV